MKPCKACGLHKEDSEFYSTWKTVCKKCVMAKNRSRLNDPERRKSYLQYQKNYQSTVGRGMRIDRFMWLAAEKDKPCEDCGQRFPPECMDHDHKDPSTKEFNVSYGAMAGFSLDRVKAEILKCRLVCANCHRIRTFAQLRRDLTAYPAR
jgi:hypothetical protein